MARRNARGGRQAAGRAPGRRRGRGTGGGRPEVRFHRKLVLNQVLLERFGVESFDALAEHLREEALEGLDENNVHRLHHALCLHLSADRRLSLPDTVLLEHDQSIVSVTQRLNERRLTLGEPPIVWKYFQYLALLFTEIYLDWYFRDADGLRAALDARIGAFNDGVDESNHLARFESDEDAGEQLNKLAFWMATGSGKTLLMHAHILLYRRALARHGRARELNRLILLTPNEGLSNQHLREFEKAGIEAEIFSKAGRGLFTGHAVEILEVTKLREDMGDKTVAVEAFEGNNLVLVDEGHRGASSGGDGTWIKHRNALCEKGFSFEYSATFGQAVKGSEKLTNVYARSILFDYSYRWFYGDGFGKDYHILNLESDRDREWMLTYMTGCLLAFYQQQRLYREGELEFRRFNLGPPLWVFVGGSVTAGLSTREAPDIVSIVKFLDEFISDRSRSTGRIRRLLSEGLQTAADENLFGDEFVYLNTRGLSAEQVFDDVMATLFNAPRNGSLHVEHLKGTDGEVALRIGDREPFGLINVGDAVKLVKLLGENDLHTSDREFAGSVFQAIDKPDSKINILIGAKKFTEGWSSWRVSTMGLMNVGQSEGAQIIQLFGRGVRLKGYGMSLKRSGKTTLFDPLERPKYIKTLETLHIFGIRANYMAQFRDFLAEEGLPVDTDPETVWIPVIRRLGSKRLKTIRLKRAIRGVQTDFGSAFRTLGPIPTLLQPDPQNRVEAQALLEQPIVLNWYPKIQAIRSRGTGEAAEGGQNQTVLTPQHVAFLDLDRLLFDMERYKAERGWFNLNLTRRGIEDLLANPGWYRLLIPASSLEFSTFELVRTWQEIALSLLKKYAERYYLFRKRQWELPHLEYRDLEETDPNFLVPEDDAEEGGYRVSVDTSHEDVIAQLTALREAIERDELRPFDFKGIKAVWLNRHLYDPLLSLEGNIVEITPAPLNKGERTFVEDLARFCEQRSDYFENRELYLLRNLSRGRGVGFFEAGGFHPDFLLWQVEGDRQYVSFVDPKGIRHIQPDHPKVSFRSTVQEIADRIGDPQVILSSFIVSNTAASIMEPLWGLSKAEMDGLNILFQVEDRETYVEKMLSRAREARGSQ